MALQPDGIVINGFDAVEQQAAIEGAAAAQIPMVSWHSGPKIGCDAPGGIFANLSTDAMTVSETAAKWAMVAGGVDGKGSSKAGSAGDGSEAAFQRIRSGQYQAITVAEPLNLQGWQFVDELNRAVSGEACSGYITAPALVTEGGLNASGDSTQFDPQNGYREACATLWGKM